jgi:hypothetical protein
MRPSGSSTAVEWYIRGTCCAASVVHVSVFGSKISAGRLPVVEVALITVEPPTASTLPSGSITRLCCQRGNAIDGTVCCVGVAPVASMTAAVLPEGPSNAGPPPV